MTAGTFMIHPRVSGLAFRVGDRSRDIGLWLGAGLEGGESCSRPQKG